MSKNPSNPNDDEAKDLRWVGNNPELDAYLYNRSLIGRLRARLPSWLGGKPPVLFTPEGGKVGLLSAVATSGLCLTVQLSLAKSRGRTKEAANIQARINAAKDAAALTFMNPGRRPG